MAESPFNSGSYYQAKRTKKVQTKGGALLWVYSDQWYLNQRSDEEGIALFNLNGAKVVASMSLSEAMELFDYQNPCSTRPA